jgi:mannose-6-phosphate isomerase-like protein (cupin superfamily)
MTDDRLIEIKRFQGEGYRPLVTHAGWRVAVLNYLAELHPTHIAEMERHLATDEVFVLVKGRGVLILGGNKARAEGLMDVEMETGTVYNIRMSTWHGILMSSDASVVIVENDDTCDANSEKCALDEGLRKQIVVLADHYGIQAPPSTLKVR